MKILQIEISGMTCNHCVQSISKAIEELGASCQINLSSKLAQVSYEESLQPQQILDAIENIGFDCKILNK